MTHSGEFLRLYFESSGVGQREIATRAKVSEGHLSKILKGERKLIRENTLSGILSALPESERGRFLHAYVMDIVPESYHRFLRESASANCVMETPSSYGEDDFSSALLATLRRTFRSPRRKQIASMLEKLTENCAASPEFLRGMESFAKLDINPAQPVAST